MDESCNRSTAWYQALSLTERIALLRASGHNTLNAKFNFDLANRRLQRWRSQTPFKTAFYFAERLAVDSISEAEFLYLLGESIEAVKNRCANVPAWLTEICQAFSDFNSSNTDTFPGQKLGELSAIAPLIDRARANLQQGVKALINPEVYVPFDSDTVVDLLLANLPKHLIVMLNRTLVLELHVARLQGHLQGETPQERFQSFMERLRQPKVAYALLQEYPVLARQIVTCLDFWVTFSLEFLRHLCSDWLAICTKFNSQEDLGLLVEVNDGLGDKHRSGKTVLIAKFSSGFQLVYKPKPLAIDVHFQELLIWLNERGKHPPFRPVKILDRGSYGWVELMINSDCNSAAEVKRFYERQGGYLALLYLLRATDFHCDNLIAAGEQPILLDLEALFQPDVSAGESQDATQLASSAIADSVLNIRLLPQRLWSNAEYEGIDVSGLGAVANQLTPYSVPDWEGVGTDEMRLVRRRVEIPVQQHRPTLKGREVNLLDYTEAIATGFTNIYRLLLKHQDELLSKNSPIADCAEDEVRVILRATKTYALLLNESFHPDVLRNALERDRLFDRLWVTVKFLPALVKLIPSEREDLLQGDIPIFTTTASSCDLYSSSSQRFADFFNQSGMARVQQRIQQLSEGDLKQQLWFIRAALATVSGVKPVAAVSLCPPQAIEKVPLAAACQIANQLETMAVRGKDDVAWIGLTQINQQWCILPSGLDLYNGIPGITLFLAYLGAIAKEPPYTALAQAALVTIRRQIEVVKPLITLIGGFDGWGGLIYTLTHLGVLWNDATLIAEAEAIVELLPPLIAQDTDLDIVSGAAGCISSLLCLYHCCPSEQVLSAARQCGDRILALAQPMEQGMAWQTRLSKGKYLTGFAHGTAGIALSLLELSAATQEERFRQVAIEAIAYERSLFSTEVGNWPDLRDLKPSGETNYMTAWCHGAAGIGLARLRSHRYLEDPQIHTEINTALQTTLTDGFASNHSLCHGAFGNLELFLQACETFPETHWCTQLNQISTPILNTLNQTGCLCALPLGIESPGLMLGLAGIGYQLLRLAEPKHVPSILVLAPPNNNS